MSELPTFSQVMHVEQTLLQGWRLNPLHMIDGIQVKENMREVGKRKKSMSPSYKAVRKDIMTGDPHVTTLVYLGRSSSGKSSDAQADYRLYKADVVLQQWSEECGIPLQMGTWPFSLGMEAAKSAKAHEEYSSYAVPPEKAHGQYSDDEYHRHSGLQKAVIEQHFFSPDVSGNARLLQIEASCPTAVPDVRGNDLVGVRGVDRGLYYAFELATREDTRQHTHVFAFSADTQVEEEGMQFRSKVTDKNATDNDVLWGDTVFTYGDREEKEETEIQKPLKLLSPSARKKARLFLPKIMASAEAKARSDRELDILMRELSDEEGIAIESDREYFAYIQGLLGLPDEQFHIIENPYFRGAKDMDLDYFIHTLPVQVFPEIAIPMTRT